MEVYTPYTYLIGWSKLTKFYYGVEYGKIRKVANPNNLWNTYFTSSKVVSYFRIHYGEPDIVQVRKKFILGTDEVKMEQAICWEKTVLSRINIVDSKWLNGRIGGDICPASNKKVNLIRYGVENVFSSTEIQEKIRKTNLRRYGVEHPSHSSELLEKKALNNIKKYGYAHPSQIPEVHQKVKRTMIERYGVPYVLQSAELKEQIQNTLLKRYGVTNPGQMDTVKEIVKTKRKLMSTRPIVLELREYSKRFNIGMGSGWYQRSDEILEELLLTLSNTYGPLS